MTVKDILGIMDISPQQIRYGTFIAAFILILYITTIALSTWMLVYTFKLEKENCECALGWKHKYVQALLIIGMISPAISLITSTYPYGIIVDMCVAILTLMYIPITYTYIRDMEESMCGCSVDPARTALKVINYINIVAISLLVLFLIIIPMVSGYSKKKESDITEIVLASPISAPARSANRLIADIPSKTSRKSSRSSRK